MSKVIILIINFKNMSLLDSMVAKCIPQIPKAVVKKISTRYIAGESIKDTIACMQRLNRAGCCATVDFLGEVITGKSQALANANEYIMVMEAIERHDLDAKISIKPTAMGLLLDEAFCHDTVKFIVEAAAAHGIFVRLDMEDVNCTQKEIDLLLKLRDRYSNVGWTAPASTVAPSTGTSCIMCSAPSRPIPTSRSPAMTKSF